MANIIKQIAKQSIKKIMWKRFSSYILMFHHITAKPQIVKSGCLLQTERFKEIIKQIPTGAFQTLDEMVRKPSLHKVTITFDDGLEDLYTIAYPFLKEQGVPFTAFIVTDFLDQPGYITSEQLRELSRDKLVTIGSHGTSHAVLKGLPMEQIEFETHRSKEILEDIIRQKVTCFAYSHGQYDKNCLRSVVIYDYALSASGGALNFLTNRNKYLTPRLNVDDSTYENQFALMRSIKG